MGSDSYDEMPRFLPGGDTYDRLLSGRLSPLDAPESLRGVAALFEAAAGPAAPQELARKSQVVAAATAEVLSSLPPLQPIPTRSRTVLSKILTAKFAAAATLAAFGLGTAAAAATGSLPGQTSNAGIHAATSLATASHQQPLGGGGSTHAPSSGNTANGSIPSTGRANIHAQYGLCTAFLGTGNTQTNTGGGSSPSSPPKYNSAAFKALIAQNDGVAGTTTYCQGVVSNHPGAAGTTGTGKPADAGNPVTAPGVGKPTDPGKPSNAGTPPGAVGSSHGQAPVSSPNSGGTGTAGTASGEGISIAGTASNGASSAGSGNATAHH